MWELDVPKSGVALELVATYQGDISSESHGHMGLEHLIQRSIFIRDGNTYRRLADSGSRRKEFWYAMESGIPEIQAWALVCMSETMDDSLYDISDTSSIPWTLNLDKQINLLLNNRVPKSHQKDAFSMIAGAVGRKVQVLDFHYVVERVKRLLDHQPCMKMNNSAEKFLASVMKQSPGLVESRTFIRSGYYFPLRKVLEGYWMRDDIIGIAFEEFAYPLLHYIAHEVHFDKKVQYESIKPTVSRRNVIWIRKCLDDPEIRKLMGENVLRDYRVLSGECMNSEAADRVIRRVVANPGAAQKISHFEPYLSHTPTQGRVLFTGTWEHEWSDGIVIYGRGQSTAINAGRCCGEYNKLSPEGDRVELYKKILRELTA